MMNGIWTDGGWLFGLLIAGGVTLLIILLMRILGGGVRREGHGVQEVRSPSSARQLLDERYARGDLTAEEYQDRVRVLGDGT